MKKIYSLIFSLFLLTNIFFPVEHVYAQEEKVDKLEYALFHLDTCPHCKDEIEFIEKEQEVVPGITAIPAPGHTPGHMAVSFSSEGEELYFVGDAIVFPFLIEKLSVIPVFDIIPDVANDTKRKLCDLLSEKQAWVLAQHFPPFPSLGHIIRKGNAYQWKPIVLT